MPVCGDFQRRRQHSATTAHRAASVCVAANPGHTAGHCKVKCSACSVQQVWWGLHWGLRKGRCAGGLWGLRFCRPVEISRGGRSTRRPQRTETCQCVNSQRWACYGALQSQMQLLQCAAGVAGPALGAAAGLGVWFVGPAVNCLFVFCLRSTHHASCSSWCLSVPISLIGVTFARSILAG